MIQKIDSNKFSLTILKVTTFSRIRQVKAEENVRAKSLRHFILANPSLKGLRFSMADYQEQDWMTNIPLYAVSELARMQ